MSKQYRYAWNIKSGTPKMEKMNPHTRNEIWKQANLDKKETYFSTKSAAKLAIATRREDERVAKRKAAGTQVPPPEPSKPTTVRGWLETIPDHAIREAAIRQCALPYKTCYVLCDAIASMRDWAHTEEGVDFWDNCYFEVS